MYCVVRISPHLSPLLSPLPSPLLSPLLSPLHSPSVQVLQLTAECKAAVGTFVEHLKGKDDSLALADEHMADEHVKILAHVRRLSWS